MTPDFQVSCYASLIIHDAFSGGFKRMSISLHNVHLISITDSAIHNEKLTNWL